MDNGNEILTKPANNSCFYPSHGCEDLLEDSILLKIFPEAKLRGKWSQNGYFIYDTDHRVKVVTSIFDPSGMNGTMGHK